VQASLELREIEATRNQVVVNWALGGYELQTAVWYESVDLDHLGERLGPAQTKGLLTHLALFEINKGVSVRPDRLELNGDWAACLDPPLARLWAQVVNGVWAQWRYENDLPDYRGPELPDPAGAAAATPEPAAEAAPTPVHRWRSDDPLLVFCGGGKDSLVAMSLLDQLEVDYDSLAYSHSVYGPATAQHGLIDALLDCCKPGRRHRQDVFDQLLGVPVTQLHGVFRPRQIIAGETPASLFGAMPIAAEHGYRHLVVAHERSANTGNLTWQATGEVINHQWGKSFEAEQLLDAYIAGAGIAGPAPSYWSILQQVHDPVIFSMLEDRLDAVPFTHSCNVSKPWCMRCPKCAYVWLNYKAWLPWEVVDPMFGGANLLNAAENQLSYRQMLGLEDHTPFECIGQVEESRLAFALCRARGLRGAAMDTFSEELGDQDYLAQAGSSLTVYDGPTGVPSELAAPLTAVLTAAADQATGYAAELLE
jgi:hypothetical protein